MNYPCAYGSETCAARFTSPTSARWHSSCAPGKAVSIANRLLKESGATIRPSLLEAGRMTDQALALMMRIPDAPSSREELERLNASQLLASSLIGALGGDRKDQPSLTVSIARLLGVRLDAASASAAGTDGLSDNQLPRGAAARLVSLELREQKRVDLAEDQPLELILEEWGLSNSPQECLWVVGYDAMMNARTVVEVARGGFHDVAVHIPALMTSVLAVASDRFQIAHNHPSGDVWPSEEDVALTARVVEAANLLSLFFEDHLIVGPGGQVFSFVDHGYLVPAQVAGHKRAPGPRV